MGSVTSLSSAVRREKELAMPSLTRRGGGETRSDVQKTELRTLVLLEKLVRGGQ